MKLIEKNKDQLIFSTEISESLTNAIRRYVNHILVLAVDELEISRNDSPLYDETIAHRVGLIPLKKSRSNEKTKVNLSVKREGSVYSGDIGGVDIVYKDIPLTTLDKGQELEFTGTVKYGIGAEHAKFSPGLLFYRNSAEIIMDKEFLDDIKRSAPDANIKEKGGKIIITDNGKKDLTDFCEGLAQKKKKKVEIAFQKEMIITVESFGQMEAKEVFKESINTLKKDLNSVAKAINKE